MPDCRRRVLRGVGGVILAGVLVAAMTPAVAEEVENRVAFTFTDEEITESSGLVAGDGLMFTINDSGDDPVVYAVDKNSGNTVAVTTYSSDPVSDVEAIAPGRGGALWVGDIGDNEAERSSVSVYRVVPLGGLEQQAEALDGQGEVIEEEAPAEKFDLVYPDSPHNAEALLVHPDTGRLYVVTKEITGATFYAAPATLEADAENELTEVGNVPGLVTDGAFFPDGEHIMLRLYGRANVFSFPGLRLRGNMRLPSQQQGEGLAISEDREIYLSTEGAYSEVLRILLPTDVQEAMGDPSPATSLPGPSASPLPESEVADPSEDGLSTGDGGWLWAAAGLLVVTVAGWVMFTVARRRGRRT